MLARDTIVAFSALGLSLVGVVTSVVQTRVMMQQQRASLLPRLQFHYSNVDDFHFEISNDGTGPATIVKVQIHTKDKEYETFADFLHTLLQADKSFDTHPEWHTVNASVVGRTLRAGQSLQPIALKGTALPLADIANKIDAADFTWEIIYQSVYSECWSLEKKKRGGATVATVRTHKLGSCPSDAIEE